MVQSHRWPGVPFALLAAVLFGASTPLAKALLGSVDPWMLAGLLYLGAGVGLAVVHVSRGTPNFLRLKLHCDGATAHGWPGLSWRAGSSGHCCSC